MVYVLYALSAIFILLSFFMLAAYSRTRHKGLLIMSICYGAGGLASGYLLSWWPLMAGFAAAWVVRVLGLDPDTQLKRNDKPSNEGNAG